MTLLRQSEAQTAAIWGRSESAALARGLSEIGLQPTPIQLEQLNIYARLLLKWNGTYNLLGATTAQALLESHLLDSLAALPALSRWLPHSDNRVLLDIGSGAGLPGVAIAIMQAHLPVALIEPIGKKTAFLRQAIAQCKLPLVHVLEGRVEDLDLPQDLLKPDPRHGTSGAHDSPGACEASGTRPSSIPRRVRADLTPHFICRAFTSLDRFAKLCTPHVATDSLLFALKATRVGEELGQLGESIEVLTVEPLNTGEKDVQRNLVVMRAKRALAASDTTRPGQ